MGRESLLVNVTKHCVWETMELCSHRSSSRKRNRIAQDIPSLACHATPVNMCRIKIHQCVLFDLAESSRFASASQQRLALLASSPILHSTTNTRRTIWKTHNSWTKVPLICTCIMFPADDILRRHGCCVFTRTLHANHFILQYNAWLLVVRAAWHIGRDRE